jgi:glycosyltransferase involved in cell wall biosynthesis
MISIVIPSFNREDCIAETLQSLKNQRYNDWECIIVDDGSIDNTDKIVKNFIAQDSRFSFYKRPVEMHKGANSCRNYGFSKAKGDFIKFLDSDDLLSKDCLEKQFIILNDNDNLQVCLSYGRYFNNSTKELEEFWSRNKEYHDYFLGHVTNQIRWAVSDPLWRKSFFTEAPFKKGLMNSQEWLMHGQSLLKLKKEEIYNLHETFTLIRRGNERMSSVRTSFYYKNQRKSRKLLLKDVLKKRPTFLMAQFQLLKQIIIFTYWVLKTK